MAITKPVQPEPEVVEESQDLQIVKSDGASVLSFLSPAALVAFFRRAGELERHAESLLSRAKALQPPSNGDEDAAIVRAIQAFKIAGKETTEHWSPRAVFYQVHKRLIAAEQRATGQIDQAVEIAQRLHNTYTADKKRKDQLDADVARRKAEAEARDQREAELARLEAEAVRAEEASETVSAREGIFVEAVALGEEPTAAASRASYRDAWKAAARLMSLPKIQQAIKAKQDAIAIRRQAEAVKEQPLAIYVPPVIADAKVGSDRQTWTGEVYDEAAFIAAFKAGTYCIPDSCITFNQKGCTELARSLKTLANIPGFRAVPKVTTI